jgi:hypothetical protein
MKLFEPVTECVEEETIEIYKVSNGVTESLGSLTLVMTLPDQDELEDNQSINKTELLSQYVKFKNPVNGEVLDDQFVAENIYKSVHAVTQCVNHFWVWVNKQSPEKNLNRQRKTGRKKR